MAEIWNYIWPILIAIFMFVIVIIIHEFGHFISAKLLGVKVNEFSLGFGPKLFSKQGKETLYSVRLIPFGGYCAMEGEDSESFDPKAFGAKKPWKRLIIVAAGAIFNIILGFILAIIMTIPQPAFATTKVAVFDEKHKPAILINLLMPSQHFQSIFSVPSSQAQAKRAKFSVAE